MNNAWKLINTAPKDGSEVFLYSEDSGAYIGTWWVAHKEWVSKYMDENECDFRVPFAPKPTHWCEIPKTFEL